VHDSPPFLGVQSANIRSDNLWASKDNQNIVARSSKY
jgi:hypothetical protein